MQGFNNVNISPEGKKKDRFRLYCSLVVILIISSTCLMNIYHSFSWLSAHRVQFSLHLLILTYICPRILKLEPVCSKHMHCVQVLLVALSLPYGLTTFSQSKLLLFWFFIRLDCGMWLVLRSDRLFSILSENLSDWLLKKNKDNLH